MKKQKHFNHADDYLKLVDDYIASKINEKNISKLVSKSFNSLMNKKNDRIIKYIRRSGIENVNETICDITNDVINNTIFFIIIFLPDKFGDCFK